MAHRDRVSRHAQGVVAAVKEQKGLVQNLQEELQEQVADDSPVHVASFRWSVFVPTVVEILQRHGTAGDSLEHCQQDEWVSLHTLPFALAVDH